MSESSNNLRWYALQVRFSRECMVAACLRAKGYESFTPTQPLHGRADTAEGSPLFPGYAFCRFSLADRSCPVVTTPGVLRIVGVGRMPQAVPDWEIDNLLRVSHIHGDIGFEERIHVGATVRIRRGPFAGIEGTLASIGGRNRVVAQIHLLGCGVSVAVNCECCEFIAPSPVTHRRLKAGANLQKAAPYPCSSAAQE